MRRKALTANVKRRSKKRGAEEQYSRYFKPTPSPLWKNNDDTFSLEQPSQLKWFPSETTYGIDVSRVPVD
jgi:hypothetical protein